MGSNRVTASPFAVREQGAHMEQEAFPLPDLGPLQPLVDKDWSRLVDLTEEGEPLATFWQSLIDLLTAREAGRGIYLDPSKSRSPQIALEEWLSFELKSHITVVSAWLELLQPEHPHLEQEMTDMQQLLMGATHLADQVLREAGIRETHHYGQQWQNKADFDIVFTLDACRHLMKEHPETVPAINDVTSLLSGWNKGIGRQHIHDPVPERNAQARAQLRAAFDALDSRLEAIPAPWDLSAEVQRELHSLQRLVRNGRNELTKYESKYGAA
jgi:protein-tyrosine-phosphatase